ncbi:MAG: ACP S-malonyltransferase [Acidobacteriia bacterium]|nr:ACP S-malonyltransferase [Terriglobia bacterium]
MSKIAFIFPGQASQYAGMGKELAEKFPAAHRVFEEADRSLGFQISKLCFDGPEEELQLTMNTQPAILAVSVAAYRVLEEKGLQPEVVAGHSLGEYSALVAAGAIPLSQAVQIVHNRGIYMQEAVPVGEGAMAAILGLPLDCVYQICADARQDEECSAANINSPAQIVIAGSKGAVERAVKLATEAGAKRAILLNVSAPFHCRLMMPAQERLEHDLMRLDFDDLSFPLVTNVDGEFITTGLAARTSLVRQVSSPVMWEDSIRAMIARDIDTFVEVGPGRVLSGVVKQIDRSRRMLNVEDEKSLTATLEALHDAVRTGR